MLKYCPACGAAHDGETEECLCCGAYVKEWRDTPMIEPKAPKAEPMNTSDDDQMLTRMIKAAVLAGAFLVVAIIAMIFGLDVNW